jgi:hypothetical protein
MFRGDRGRRIMFWWMWVLVGFIGLNYIALAQHLTLNHAVVLLGIIYFSARVGWILNEETKKYIRKT